SSHPPKSGPLTSHFLRLPSEVKMNAPLRVPTSTRTPLIALPPRGPSDVVSPYDDAGTTNSSRSAVHQGARRGEQLACLQPRLQAGQDHGPAAVELVVRALPQLVVGEGQPAGVADRLDLPGHPRRALGLH